MRSAVVKSKPRQFIWRQSQETRVLFDRLVEQHTKLNEMSPEAIDIEKQIRMLPGYPTDAGPNDIINLEVIRPVYSTSNN